MINYEKFSRKQIEYSSSQPFRFLSKSLKNKLRFVRRSLNRSETNFSNFYTAASHLSCHLITPGSVTRSIGSRDLIITFSPWSDPSNPIPRMTRSRWLAATGQVIHSLHSPSSRSQFHSRDRAEISEACTLARGGSPGAVGVAIEIGTASKRRGENE